MKIPLTYGGLSAIAGAVLTLLLYFAGLHDSVEKLSTAQWAGGLVGAAIMIVALALAMREKRAKAPADVEWSYGSAFGTGALTAVVAAVLGAVFYFVYASFINPGFTDIIFQAQQAKMEQMGLSATEIAQREQGMRLFMTPALSALFQAVFASIVSILFALVVAIFFRHRATQEIASDQPPTIA